MGKTSSKCHQPGDTCYQSDCVATGCAQPAGWREGAETVAKWRTRPCRRPNPLGILAVAPPSEFANRNPSWQSRLPRLSGAKPVDIREKKPSILGSDRGPASAFA